MNDKQMKRAAAIKYDQAKNMAPRVVAKGKGRIAEQIIQVARENDVPLHDDPNLANVLEAMELESEIPADLYRAVAEVLVFIYRLNGRLK
jgi:flagellar biosynthesis protein